MEKPIKKFKKINFYAPSIVNNVTTKSMEHTVDATSQSHYPAYQYYKQRNALK